MNASVASSLVSSSSAIPNRTAVPDWFIDPIAGNDSNNGLTAPTAFKTLTRWYQVACNYGQYPFISNAVTVHILSDLVASDTPVLNFSVGGIGNGAVRFVGTPTAVYTSSGAGVTVAAAVPAANSHWRLTDTNLTDWAPYVSASFSKYRIRMLDTGAIIWPASRTSAHVAVVSSPMQVDTLAGAYGQSIVPLTNGETFVIEALPVLTGVGFNLTIVESFFNAPEPVLFDSLAFEGASYVQVNSTSELGGQVGFYGCSFAALQSAGGEFVDCRTIDVFIQRSSTFLAGLAASGVISGDDGVAVFDQEYFLQDAIIACESKMIVSSVQLAGASAIDCDNSGDQQLIGFLAGGGATIWGTSSLASIIRVEPNGKVTYFDTATLTAVGSGGASQAVCVGIPGSSSAVLLPYSSLPYADAGSLTCVDQAEHGAQGGAVAVHSTWYFELDATTVNAATATFAFSSKFSLVAQTCAGVEVFAEGMNAAGAASTFIYSRASVRRGAAGGLVVSATLAPVLTGDAALSGAVLAVIANGNGFDVTIVGVAAQTIAWKVSVRILRNPGNA